MSTVRWLSRKSRLAGMVDKPGGVSVGVALAQAKENLSTLQARSNAIVAERIAELAALPEPARDDPYASEAREKAYRLSSAVIDAAGPFELTDLCAAASGLCDLIDGAPKDRPFDWRIVTVHAQALQLILSLPTEAFDARAQVLGSLKEVLQKKLPSRDQPAG